MTSFTIKLSTDRCVSAVYIVIMLVHRVKYDIFFSFFYLHFAININLYLSAIVAYIPLPLLYPFVIEVPIPL